MATKPNTTVPPVSSRLQVVLILLTPAWIILATFAHAVISGEVAL